MDVGPIPWTAADRWAERHGIADGQDFDDFWRLVSACDDEWRKVRAEKAKADADRKSANKDRQEKYNQRNRR